MATQKRIVIVGAGVVGLCTAHYALQHGHQVTIIERGGRSHDSCSLGNAGMIVPSHFVPLAAPGMVAMGLRMLLRSDSPFAITPRLDPELIRWCRLFAGNCNPGHVEKSAPLLRDLNLASRKLYEELSGAWGNTFGLTKRGLLMLCKSEHTFHEEAAFAEKAHALGLPAEVLSPSETAKTDPGVRMDIAGSVYFPQDCHLTPQDFVRALTGEVERAGGHICWDTEVTGWRTAGDRIAAARIAGSEVTADEFVLAGGSWSAESLRNLDLRLPLQAGKGYSMTLAKPRQLPTLCSIFTEARVAVTPMGDTLRFGGTMEITGTDLSISERRVQGIVKSIPKYFPEFTPDDFRSAPVWTGLRPCSPDGLPYVGRFRKHHNLCAATGHSMMGVSLGPITGKLVAALLSDEKTDIDIQALSPDRYG